MPKWLLDVNGQPGSEHRQMWDIRVAPGSYRLIFWGSWANARNLMHVGRVPSIDQPYPIHPSDRCGTIANIQSINYNLRTTAPFPVSAEWLRIESWNSRSERNPYPLPPGWTHWNTLIRRPGSNVKGDDIFADVPDFGKEWLGRLNCAPEMNPGPHTPDVVYFQMEDFVDGDFDDLIGGLERYAD
jgi:hypothetical protein